MQRLLNNSNKYLHTQVFYKTIFVIGIVAFAMLMHNREVFACSISEGYSDVESRCLKVKISNLSRSFPNPTAVFPVNGHAVDGRFQMTLIGRYLNNDRPDENMEVTQDNLKIGVYRMSGPGTEENGPVKFSLKENSGGKIGVLLDDPKPGRYAIMWEPPADYCPRTYNTAPDIGPGVRLGEFQLTPKADLPKTLGTISLTGGEVLETSDWGAQCSGPHKSTVAELKFDFDIPSAFAPWAVQNIVPKAIIDGEFYDVDYKTSIRTDESDEISLYSKKGGKTVYCSSKDANKESLVLASGTHTLKFTADLPSDSDDMATLETNEVSFKLDCEEGDVAVESKAKQSGDNRDPETVEVSGEDGGEGCAAAGAGNLISFALLGLVAFFRRRQA